MANSRLEKIGTIYTRTKGLLQAGAMKWLDRPVWYDVYETFPPKEEPRFDRPAPKIRLHTIFYKEDNIRASFHLNNKTIGAINMLSKKGKTVTQRFIDCYQTLQKQYDGNEVPEAQLYAEAIELLQKERELKAEEAADNVSLSFAFKHAQELNKQVAPRENISINVKDIFKE